MVRVIVYWVLIFGSILAFANAAKCYRSQNSVITCEKADKGVIRRLGAYYENDLGLIVKDSSISTLKSGMFGELKSLEKLSLTRCEIRIIHDGVFENLNLTHLNLAMNLIRDIPQTVFTNLNHLRFLDLSHNLISRLELNAEVGFLPKLNYIDVSNNRLKNFTLVGNFSDLETINFENNTLTKFQIDVIYLPNIKNVFFDGNSFNKSKENFLSFVFMSCDIKIDIENTTFDDGWDTPKNMTKKRSANATTAAEEFARSFRNGIEKDFKLTPEFIKSLNQSQLTSLVERILVLRNFTANERKMLETDRELIRNESRHVKRELARIDQLIKRFTEVSREAVQETVDEYIEESCESMPDNTWWKRAKKWTCKKLFNWVKKLI